MKQFFKKMVIVASAGVLLFLIAIVGIEVVRVSTEHKLSRLVAELKPGTPLNIVTSKLGMATYVFTNATEIEQWGVSLKESVKTNSTLYLFSTNTIPICWICVYVGNDSKAVTYAAWKDM